LSKPCASQNVVEASRRASLVRVRIWSRHFVRRFVSSHLCGQSFWRGFLRGLFFLIVDCGYPMFWYLTPMSFLLFALLGHWPSPLCSLFGLCRRRPHLLAYASMEPSTRCGRTTACGACKRRRATHGPRHRCPLSEGADRSGFSASPPPAGLSQRDFYGIPWRSCFDCSVW
jgi:hypothetical protein